MAQTIVTFCDACLADGIQAPAETWTMMALRPGARKQVLYEVDVCPDHAKAYVELTEFLGDYARRAGDPAVLSPQTPTVPKADRVASRASQEAANGGCPVCHHPLKDTPSALDSHARHVHGVTAAEVLGDATMPCGHQGCGRKFTARQGLANHWRLVHDGVRPPGQD